MAEMRIRLRRARMKGTGSQLRSYEVPEVIAALRLYETIKAYGPHAVLRVRATGVDAWNIYDPSKPGAKQ